MKWDQVIQTPLSRFVEMVNAHEPFAFSRWGDGEWHCMLKPHWGTNCDFHPYSEQLGAQLKGVLASRPAYMLGMQRMALRVYPGGIEKLIEQLGIADMAWHNSDIVHDNVLTPDFANFVAAIRNRPTVVVGPKFLQQPLANLLGYCEFVEVPRRNCYAELPRIFAETLAAIDKIGKPSFVSLSCSMPAEILLDSVWRARGGERCPHTIFDMGAVWDPYGKVFNRTYQRNMRKNGQQLPTVAELPSVV